MGVQGQGIRGCQRGWGGHLIPGGPRVERARGGALIDPILKGEGRTMSTTGSSMPANDAHSLVNESEQALVCQQMMLIHW